MPEEDNKPSIEDQLLANAVSPKSVEIDGQTIEQHSLKDQIEALKFAASVKASKSSKPGIRFAKMNHGGAI